MSDSRQPRSPTNLPEAPSLEGLAAAFAATPEEPTSGQVWRARWGDTAIVVIVLAAGRDQIDAVPLTPDVEFADERGVVIDGSELPLGFEAVAWTGVRTSLPIRVLDVMLGWVS